MEHQRAALALVNGVVYIAWGSHEDRAPFYGWIMGYVYDGSKFNQSYVLNTGPNTHEVGIWMGGAAPAADSPGRVADLQKRLAAAEAELRRSRGTMRMALDIGRFGSLSA